MSELQDALDRCDDNRYTPGTLDTIMEAARAVLEADEWKICVTHHSRAALANFCQYSHMCSMMGKPTNIDCHMVTARLVI